jgi:hypothetical protein
MKKYIYTYLTAFLLFCLFSSCTKNFESINADPNRPIQINPGVMLGQLEYQFVNSSIGGSNNFTHDLMQVNAPRSSTSGGVHRYYILPGAALWTGFYNRMADVEDIISISEKLKENNYKAIALVYKSWAYSILTDLYGDVPYSETAKATVGNYLPKFDSQKDYLRIKSFCSEVPIMMGFGISTKKALETSASRVVSKLIKKGIFKN